jgi:GT2 family glycosyltransferase
VNVIEKPAVSVVILTWNGTAYIKPCLTALLAQEYPQPEVIVVDNASSDGTPDFIATEFPDVRLIRNQRNLGFSAGNNIGLQAASGDLLVLLNQDTQVHAGWLAALALAFEEPGAGIVGCKLLYPDGTIQHAGGYLHGPRGLTGHVGRHAAAEGQFDQLADSDFVTGAAIAISRETLAQIGPLDEGFAPAYYEDIDWCYRAHSAGYRVLYQPQAVLTHHESTATDALTYRRTYALIQGRLRFLIKHWPLDRLLNEFAPAEMAWLASLPCSKELTAARFAYLNNLLALPAILSFRASSPTEADALVNLLTDLRMTAQTVVAHMDAPSTAGWEGTTSSEQAPAALLGTLEDSHELREQPFTSHVPGFGPLIVAFRSLWNSVATRWYVRPIAHQQSVFNAQLIDYLESVEQRLQMQSGCIAANLGELTALAEYLARKEEGDSQGNASE